LWRTTAGATRLAIEFPVKAGGTRTATFDVAGLDASKLPGWPQASLGSVGACPQDRSTAAPDSFMLTLSWRLL
jgi:hypothetical protein